MFATLPDFTPRDSHSLWYTSSRNPFLPSVPVDNHNADSGSNQHGSNQSRQRGQLLEQTLLARLARDEQNMHRRRVNVQNFGSAWLKPPGVPKTLYQLREEKREQEEHQEAMRREQLAQELAEAEAEGGMTDDGMMDDVQLDGAQDLDDEIPDADDDYDLDDDDDDEEEEEEEEEEDEEEEEEEDEGEDEEEADDGDALREERQHDIMAARMRMTDDAFREALVRGDAEAHDMYGGEEELEAQDQGQMLDEEDFTYDGALDDGMAGDMDADLDDDIPEADDGGYEHTDSEAEVSSDNSSGSEEEGDNSDDDDGVQDISFAPRAAPLGPPQSPTLRGGIFGIRPGPRVSMDMSGLLSQDESSFMESSPAMSRRPRRK